jgi:2-(3-amino-3-carboxypropyl)histidine synthase
MEEVIRSLKKLNARRVLIQFGEGLKLRIQDMARELNANGIECFICLEKCFGACDVREHEARLLGCDAILHIGHEKLIETKLPVVYWEYFLEADPIPILEREMHKLRGFKRIGLIASIQFVKLLPRVKDYLERLGKEVLVHKALQHPGQVLGCRLEAAISIEPKVDCFLCLSAGEFYAAGVVLCVDKPVLNLDLERGEIRSLQGFKEKVQRFVAWNKAQLEDARKVGLLVSWKRGQLANPFEVKEKLEELGKEVFLLAMDEITPEKLEGLELDALVNFACPRIGIDEIERYRTPLINADMLFFAKGLIKS